MKHYKTGLVIGRFQPFHNGHAYLIKKALILCDIVIIGIGSANVENFDNPWNFRQRKQMLEQFIAKENLKGKVRKIIPLIDTTDELWTQEVVKQAADADVVIGNNDWVNTLLKDVGFAIVTLPYYKRYQLEGQKIRMLMKKKNLGKPACHIILLTILRNNRYHCKKINQNFYKVTSPLPL